jgi:hypothetical protein
MKNDDTTEFWTLAVDNEAEGKPIRVGFIFAGLATADITWLFAGHILKIAEHSRRGTRIDCVEFGRRKQRELPLREINRDRFPSAPETSIGRMIPIVFGGVRDCPGIPIVGYTVGIDAPRIVDPHTEDDTTIRITHLIGIPPAGRMLIGTEEISYGGTTENYPYADDVVSALLGCTRGLNSTAAIAHSDGDEIQVPTTHYFIFADHACVGMFSPRVEGRLPASAYEIERSNTLFRRDASSLSAFISFTQRPPMYRVFSSASEIFNVLPTETAGDNSATDPANAWDEIENNSFAVIDSVNTPLSLNMRTDLTGFDDSKGAIVKARWAIESEASDNTTVDQIDFIVGDI